MEVEQQKPQLKASDFLLPGQQLLYPELEKQKVNKSLFTFNNQQVLSKYSGVTTIKQEDQKVSITLLRTPLKYFPSVKENVIGVVRHRDADNYYLDINTSTDGVLGQLEFNGATKRNKPNLQLGDAVLCYVTECNKYLQPKLSCMSVNDKDWATGETKYGLLKGHGNLLSINPHKFKYIQQCCDKIGKEVNFEVVYGKNGIVYISTNKSKNLVVISNLLQKANKESIDHILQKIHDLVQK